MKILIVGAGTAGKTLVNLLSSEKHDITVIEKDDVKANDLANKADCLVIKGDATEISILKDAGMEKADALVAATDDDKTNLMVCQIAKSSDVHKIISIINKPEDEELFTKLGIYLVAPMIGTAVTAIKRMLYQYGDERIIAQLGKGDVQVIEITIQKESKLIDSKATIRKGVIATIYRNGELIIPNKKTILKEGDVLLVAVKTKDLDRVTKLITGK